MASSLLTSSKQQVKRLVYKITLKAHPLFWDVLFYVLRYFILFSPTRHNASSIRLYML